MMRDNETKIASYIVLDRYTDAAEYAHEQGAEAVLSAMKQAYEDGHKEAVTERDALRATCRALAEALDSLLAIYEKWDTPLHVSKETVERAENALEQYRAGQNDDT